MSKLSIGTAQFGLDYGIANKLGKVSFDEVQKILSEAKRHNIDTIDTAAAYGNSESVLGTSGVEQFDIITNLPEIPDNV